MADAAGTMPDGCHNAAPGSQGWPVIAAAAAITLALIAAAALVIANAVPISDSDIWFHLAYGRYFIEHRTIVPDHTVFSWTPSDNETIYCAWIPQVAFYLLHEAFGMKALHALRLGVIAAVGLLAFRMARPSPGSPRFMVFMATALTGFLMLAAGLRIKPDLFSYMYMAVMTWAWFAVKAGIIRPRALLVVFPGVMLMWVNSHGAFIFGMVFLGALCVGEMAEKVFGGRQQGSQPEKRPSVLVASALGMAAVVFTPYGLAYPLQLLNSLLGADFARHMQSIAEYQTIFYPGALGLHYVEYLVAGAVFLAWFAVPAFRRTRVDWAVVIVNLAFAALYMRFLRVTYFWAVVLLFTCAYLAGGYRDDAEKKRTRSYGLFSHAVVPLAVVFLSIRVLYETFALPGMGWNPAYVAPEQEARYIRENLPGAVLGNDYAAGSYLMWALWPDYRVFIDARYFPYRSWYDMYDAFESARSPEMFDRFLDRWPCTSWCVSYDFEKMEHFVKSRRWRIGMYGPSACVFVKTGSGYPEIRLEVKRLVEGAGFYQRQKILRFAVSIHDLQAASGVFRTLRPIPVSLMQVQSSLDSAGMLGSQLSGEGRYMEAVNVYRRALSWAHISRIVPGALRGKTGRLMARLKVNLAMALMMMNRPAEALDELKGAHELDADLPAARELGYRAERAVERARETSATLEEKALKSPGDLKTLAALVSALVAIGDMDKAGDVQSRLVEKDPENPDMLYNLACIRARMGRPREAMDILKKAVEKGFGDVRLLESDPDLASIRETDGFAEIVRSAQGR